MFHNTVLRRSEEDERRERQGDGPGSSSAGYAHSPTNRQSNPPTPTHLFDPVRNQPASPSTSTLPPIASALFSRESHVSKYYDPTSDQGTRPTARINGNFNGQYPAQTSPAFNHVDTRTAEPNPFDKVNHSPVYPLHSPTQHQSSHSHPSNRVDRPSQSPVSPRPFQLYNRAPLPNNPTASERRPSIDRHQKTPSRTADPMSLSSIMSGNDPEPENTSYIPPKQRSRPSSKSSNFVPYAVRPEQALSHAHADTMVESRTPHDDHSVKPIQNGTTSYNRSQFISPPSALVVSEKDIEAEMAKIDSMDLSDVDGPGYETQRQIYKQRSQKRFLDVETVEREKRKRRRYATVKRHQDVFTAHAAIEKKAHGNLHEQEAWEEVQQQEIRDEKERKKDMQRKRRREKTLQNEVQKREEALELAAQAQDEESKEKHLRDAQRADKKAKVTNQLLQGGTPSKDIREVTPHAPNLEGGMMSTFQMSEDLPKDSKKKGRASTRPRKSKEQKQAEKQAAADAHAALERGEEPSAIAPKEQERLEALTLKRELSQTEDVVAPMATKTAYSSDVYNQLYESIWRDISKNVAKVYRIKENSLATKQSNLRKTAQLASKEARRWQLKTNKSAKDIQARAKRSMREMLSFWKRNERDERDQRKAAERQELENAKRAEAEREANRQKRKLNFLISQTELYSHFIGKKIKTDDIERSTDDAEVAASDQKLTNGKPNAHTVDLPDSVAKPGTKVTNFEDLDFDAEDETKLREAAMANAQHAVQEAQDRARAFNEEGNEPMSQFDDGEMNFQNPTSLQNMDVAQPSLLTCQLKEYQLKGLNWLVNLYEQGINGILADEMGLGKTVQSISVMAYLAEVHNIWGPFLVIAPASTLHNWQQEIARFVPDLKIVPYWGTAKDRKVLRKFWDRKHITYKRDASFHVLVTSYQLVVQDAQYFQKMKWQYMILDEAQAIKSSQSSRWKNLLGFHCRNRLLLTGTPIQNNMQELWALLHFIMPSLFDSHDEFSDWFSKDIESHAQSNTKLNEDQLKRLHMILKPFMLRRIKKHVQKELGDKVELDVFCDLTYRQRAYYTNLRNKISIMDLIEKAALGDDQDSATLMNLVMQFRKVCNHPDLFERADTSSPFSFSYFAETASFLREGNNIPVAYSVRNPIEFRVPRLIGRNGGRLDIPGPDNTKAGFKGRYLDNLMNVWTSDNILMSSRENGAFAWLRFADISATEVASIARTDAFERAVNLKRKSMPLARFHIYDDEEQTAGYTPTHALFNIVDRNDRRPLAEINPDSCMFNLLNVTNKIKSDSALTNIEECATPSASAPPIELYCASQGVIAEKYRDFFDPQKRRALFGISEKAEVNLLENKVDPADFPVNNMLPPPDNQKARYTHIQVPSMRRFVTDSGKLAKLDQLLRELKEGGHRVLLYFQMTRMIDLMEEYLTYRNYKYCRLDGSTKLEDRRDTVADFQSKPEIFVFLLSTRAGGLGINLTSADTVIFYDSDWNPTIDSQAMDRAHRLGQTKQVTVYRMITRGTIEERIRKRALQKEEVQRVVISGGAGAQVDFNTRSRENRTKDIAMWLADDDQAAEIEKKEAEIAAQEASGDKKEGRKKKAAGGKKGKEINLDDMYHEGEGHFDDGSAKPSGTVTPVPATESPVKGKRKGVSKKAKSLKQRLAIADGGDDVGL
ncbi:hypothetical protein M501DRAFT_929765 [Patellaria atrata CBS 101060]|uniref:Chromatin-remodeling ATPase INO80 n=1 Tax=Patellaria atrata CBS 101060 TaxID=1346257 RepID=A0A9P4VQ62_9PEZI|nr:hypothetical protein M501DRAFT_929765 [Patellaria atrata CBS 101060]